MLPAEVFVHGDGQLAKLDPHTLGQGVDCAAGTGSVSEMGPFTRVPFSRRSIV